MATEGYEPHQAISCLALYVAQSKEGSMPEFLYTHPSDATRITRIQNLMPKAMKYYKGK